MVADVVRIMNEQQQQHQQQVVEVVGGKSRRTREELITRDLLGGSHLGDSSSSSSSSSTSSSFTTELDLDLQVPHGWEKRLDLKSGKVYLQKFNSTNTSTSSSGQKAQTHQTAPKFEELNFPAASKTPLNLFDDISLDLKLVPLASSASSSSYESVCTLDKVKSALERAERETIKKRSISMSKSSSPMPSNSSSSVKDIDLDDDADKSSSAYAAGCPSCLLYVLITKRDPKCPRCHATVPTPTLMKKPRIDLNISI